jgi:hypothetical protein
VATYTLIVSNPPHGEVDPARAAPGLGLSPAEIRMKANYPVPEIWLAANEAVTMEETVAELAAAGLNVAIVPGDALGALPPREEVQSFVFSDAGFVAAVEGAEVAIPYDASATAVYCTPRQPSGLDPAHTGGSGITEGLTRRSSAVGRAGGGVGESSFLDVYFTDGGTARRLTVLQNSVDFGGLGKLALPNATTNMEMLVQEFEERLTNGSVDRRLVNMQPRQRPMVGRPAPEHPERKGFSFATEALNRLLESISPDLKEASQFELSSRLAFLTAP